MSHIHTQSLPKPLTLVVGARGLIGREILACCPTNAVGLPVDWSSRETVAASMEVGMERFFDTGQWSGDWRAIWAAGQCVVSSSAHDLKVETDYFSVLLNVISRQVPDFDKGQIGFISSAGGVYGGSSTPQPFSESAQLGAISPYGNAKIEQEQLLGVMGEALGVQATILRPANVYGLGQDLSKSQGLVSHLCRVAMEQTSIDLWVPLSTQRHYITARDAAQKIMMTMDAHRILGSPLALKNIFGDRAISVGSLISLVESVSGRRIHVNDEQNAQSQQQPLDMLLSSEVFDEVDAYSCIPLETGIRELLHASGEPGTCGTPSET